MSESIEIEITGREAGLILRYGYPFPEEAAYFEKVAGMSGYHQVTIERFWLETIIGDLCRSVKKVRSIPLQEELNSLCDSLEIAMGNAYPSGFHLT